MGNFRETPKLPLTLLYNYFILIIINNINKYKAIAPKQGMSKILIFLFCEMSARVRRGRKRAGLPELPRRRFQLPGLKADPPALV